MSQPAAEAEIDRYITLPGQAVSYKIGERAIRDLRAKAEETWENFDLKRFHTGVLKCVGPLDYLENCVKEEYFNVTE